MLYSTAQLIGLTLFSGDFKVRCMVDGINNAPRVKARHPFVRMAPRVSDSDQALPPTTIGTRLTQLH